MRSRNFLQQVLNGDGDKIVKLFVTCVEDAKTEDYKAGYEQALKDINTPMQMITEDWKPSKCPACHNRFYDYEPCDDGYYDRATSLERCPFCGQKIIWNEL